MPSFFIFVLQRGSFQTQTGGRAARAREHSSRFTEHLPKRNRAHFASYRGHSKGRDRDAEVGRPPRSRERQEVDRRGERCGDANEPSNARPVGVFRFAYKGRGRSIGLMGHGQTNGKVVGALDRFSTGVGSS